MNTTQDLYTKNEKIYTYFCYKILFSLDINNELEYKVIENQTLNI